ncbi:MAG: hypothetical protein ACK5MI_07135 [Mangrovibacterium sp.]
MIKAIFYKEWIKLRTIIAAIIGIFVLLAFYLGVDIQTKLRVAGAAHLWDMIVNKDANFTALLKYIPCFCGLTIGLFQFVPEMGRRSLKLTLHLPISPRKTIAAMMLFGITVQAIGYILYLLILFSLLSFKLPHEILSAWAWATIPWFTAGFTAYFLSCWICIESIWKRRIINGVFSLLLMSVFLTPSGSYGFQYMNLVLLVLTILCSLFPFYSVYRFKEGVQA